MRKIFTSFSGRRIGAPQLLNVNGEYFNSAVRFTSWCARGASETTQSILVKAIDAAMTTSSKVPMLNVANVVSTDSYLVPKEDLQALKKAITAVGAHHVFLRSSVGSGKSSLMKILAKYDENIFYCSFSKVTACEIDFERILGGAVDHKGRRLSNDSTKPVWDDIKSLFHAHAVPALNQAWCEFNDTMRKKPPTDGKFYPAKPEELADEMIVDFLVKLFLQHRLLTTFAMQAIVQNKPLIKGDWAIDNRNMGSTKKSAAAYATWNSADFRYRYAAGAVLMFLSNSSLATTKLSDCRSAIINGHFESYCEGINLCNKLLAEGCMDGSQFSGLLHRGAARLTTDDCATWANPFVVRFFAKQKYAIKPIVEDFSPLACSSGNRVF